MKENYLQFTIKVCLTTFLLIFFSLFFAQKIHLPTDDLGRHITNGRIFLEQGTIIDENFYSYTEPDYPTVTHHWASGVIFYLLWKLFGFKGLSVFYILIHIITFYLFFTVSRRKSNFYIAFFCATLAIPLLADRIDIRPEGFSYLFLGIYFFILHNIKEHRYSHKVLYIFPILQIIWVNCHVYFPMGLFLIGVFSLSAWLRKENAIHYLLAFCFSVLACLINPFGFSGFITPFTIFREYGYMVAENQSLLFMQARFGKLIYIHFEILCAVSLILIILLIIQKKVRSFFSEILIIIIFSMLGWKMSRGIALFGYFFIPIAASFSYACLDNQLQSVKRFINIILIINSIALIGGGFLLGGHYFSPIRGRGGIGLLPGVERSALFFDKNNISGPIFNNYDIGSYLIFYLFPNIRPFVDNRPEAYSVSFFKNIYVPMQENEAVWHRINDRFSFNAIFFYRHDMTPWAQPFLIRRLEDPKWAPVYVDNYVLILLRRNNKNERIIKKYELPKNIFVVNKNI